MKIEAREYTQLDKIYNSVSFFGWFILSFVADIAGDKWLGFIMCLAAIAFAVINIVRISEHNKWEQQNEKP